MFHSRGFSMEDIEIAALLVSRVCHDLVSPVGAVVNGLEVLEDENDATMRADALRLVAASAELARWCGCLPKASARWRASSRPDWMAVRSSHISHPGLRSISVQNCR